MVREYLQNFDIETKTQQIEYLLDQMADFIPNKLSENAFSDFILNSAFKDLVLDQCLNK